MMSLKTLHKRGLALLLVLTMCLSLLQVPAFAADGDESGEAQPTQSEPADTGNGETSAGSEDPTGSEETTGGEIANGGEIAGGEDADSSEDPTDGQEIADSSEDAGDVTNSTDDDANGTGDSEEPSENDPAGTSGEDPENGGTDSETEDDPAAGETEETEVPAAVQAFLDAVAQLPAVEEIPEEAAEAEVEALRVLVEACQDAYDALTAEDLAREDVGAALVTMSAVIDAFYGIRVLDETTEGVSWDAETKTLTISGEVSDWTNAVSNSDWTQAETLVVSDIALSTRMFSSFKSLTSVTLNNVTIPAGTYPFSGAGAETGMTVTVTGGSLGGQYAFWNCKTLTSVTMTGVTIPEKAYAFYEAGAAEGMTLTVDNCEIGSYAFASTGTLTTATVKNCTIGECAFLSCAQLSSITLEGDNTIEKNAFQRCGLTSLELSGPVSIGNGAFSFNESLTSIKLTGAVTIDLNAFYGCNSVETVEISNCNAVGYHAFRGCGVRALTLSGVQNVEWMAFHDCSKLETVTLTNVGLLDGGAFYGCDNLKSINIDEGTQLGYLNSHAFLEIPGLSDRVEAIMRGTFKLDPAPSIVELEPAAGWDKSTVGKSANWNEYNYGTQLVEQARWTNDDKTAAEVKVDAYYTAPQQMDYIFVLDLSNSMTLLGNPKDMNARFYDMQSKLLDVSGQLLNSPGYDCRVAFVTFGLTSSNSFGFYSDSASASSAINSLVPYYENTNYGLGLGNAATLLESQEAGRKTTVIFISDGQPRDGKDNSTYDLDGAIAAQKIKEDGVSIYGVLQSVPADEYEGAEAAMKNVCSNGMFFKSSDTAEFSEAVNGAITAAYTNHTVTIPVSPDFENVRNMDVSVSAGEAVLNSDGKTITWTITGMPFTKHTLTYEMSLTEENAAKYGDQSYPVNADNAAFEDGASVESPVLTRTVEDPSTPPTPATGSYTVIHNYYTNGILTGSVSRTVENVAVGTEVNGDDVGRIFSYGGNTYTFTSATGSVTVVADGDSGTITLRYDRTVTYVPPYTPPTGGGGTTTIPSTPTPTAPGGDSGTDIGDNETPLALTGLNTIDHVAYIIGYQDGTVRPEGNITRAEVATIFFRLMLDEFRTANWSVESGFPDVVSTSWYNNAVATCAKAGIVGGYADGEFKGNQNITRAEFAAIAARFLSDEYTGPTGRFSDISGHWAEHEIDRAVAEGWINGYADGTFRPDQDITRAEAVTLINRMLDRMPDPEHLLENMIRWPDNTEDKWYYEDIQEATNSHDYDRDEIGFMEVWTEKLEERNWKEFEYEWSTAASAPGGEVADNLYRAPGAEPDAESDSENVPETTGGDDE